jgi:hypothetical protein
VSAILLALFKILKIKEIGNHMVLSRPQSAVLSPNPAVCQWAFSSTLFLVGLYCMQGMISGVENIYPLAIIAEWK